MDPRPSPNSVEETLGPRYAFIEEAGRGQASIVYKVADRLSGNEIKAAKVYQLPEAEKEARREEISHEFLLGSRFEHPNLVRYMDLHLDGKSSHALVTMEYLGGPVLELGAERLDPDLAGAVFLLLLRALGALHEAGYIHGDVKPSNVWCRIDDEVPRLKLLDYHLTYRKTEITGTTSRGTLRYLSPEAISGGEVDERSDLYAAGVFFYELLQGRPLYDGAPRDLARKHVTAAVPKLEIDDPRSAELDGYLAKLLAKKSVSRFAGAAEAAGELVKVLSLPSSVENVETLAARIRSVPVVARESDMAGIRTLIESGKPTMSVLTIEGTAGLGKSRLVRECLRLAQSKGMPNVRFEELRGAEAVAAQVESALGGRAAPKRRPFRRMAAGGSTSPAYGSEGLSTDMLARLNELSEGIAERARSEPILLACDDAHRAAPDAVQALLFLMRALHDRPVRWCMSASPGGLPAPLREEIAKAGAPAEITLAELSIPERKSLVASALPKKCAPGLIEEIVGLCGGAPSALLRRTEHLVRCGALKCDADGVLYLDPAVPAKEVAVLGADAADWLKEVPDDVRSAAELLAVAGGEVRLAHLADAIGADAGVLRRMMCSDAVAPFISCRDAQDAVLVRFQYNESYGQVLGLLADERKCRLHDRLADALVRCADSPLWEIARHRLMGCAPRDGVQLVMTLLAEAVPGMPGETAAVLDMALPLARGNDRVTLIEARAEAHLGAGNGEAAEKTYREILSRKRIEPERRLRLLRKLASLLAGRQEVDAALELLNEAKAHPDVDDFPKEKAEIYLGIVEAETKTKSANPADVEAHCEIAIRMGEELADDSLVGRVLTTQGGFRRDCNDMERALSSLIKAVRRVRRSRDAVATGDALRALGYHAMIRNRFRRASDFLERAGEAYRVAGRLADAARVTLTMGSNYHQQCEWEKALERYDEALRLFRMVGRVGGQTAALGNKSHVCSESGRLEQAIQCAEEALELCGNDAGGRCFAMHRLAYAQYLLGLIDEASDNVNALIEEAEGASLSVQLEAGHRLAAAISVSRRDWKRALSHTKVALGIAAAGSRTQETEGLARLAEISLNMGKRQEALDLAERSVALARRMGNDHALALALLARGRIQSRVGKDDEALETLKEAERLFTKGWIWKDIMTVSIELCRIYRKRGELRFASYYLRSAADVVDHVLAQMKSDWAKEVFLNDPRRRELMAEAQALREAVERGVSDDEGA
jgi:tetratricopeptide (TPR) repeat protein/tRNA A-37 threonylcarbamoyl transferase component Bud32